MPLSEYRSFRCIHILSAIGRFGFQSSGTESHRLALFIFNSECQSALELIINVAGIVLAPQNSGSKHIFIRKSDRSAVIPASCPAVRHGTDPELFCHIPGDAAPVEILCRRRVRIIPQVTAEEVAEFSIYCNQPFPLSTF